MGLVMVAIVQYPFLNVSLGMRAPKIEDGASSTTPAFARLRDDVTFRVAAWHACLAAWKVRVPGGVGVDSAMPTPGWIGGSIMEIYPCTVVSPYRLFKSIHNLFSLVVRTKMRAETALSRTFTLR
jgi:hypothetical protein